MPSRSPKDVIESIEQCLTAWQQLAPGESFGGLTLAEFTKFVTASRESRALVEEYEAKKTEAIIQREANDELAMEKRQFVVNGVLANPAFGDDSALYKEMGYTTKSERKSGLTRKKPTEKAVKS